MFVEANFTATFFFGEDMHSSFGNYEEVILLDDALIGGSDALFQFFTDFILHVLRPVTDEEEAGLDNIEVIPVVHLVAQLLVELHQYIVLLVDLEGIVD